MSGPKAFETCLVFLTACILMTENAGGVVKESSPHSSQYARHILELAEKNLENVDEPDTWLLQIFATARAAVGNTMDALQTLDLIGDGQSRSKALKWIARTLLDVGDITGALHVALHMEDLLERVRVLNNVAVAQESHGDAHGAATTLAQSVLAARESGELWIRNAGIADVAKSHAVIGDVAGALSTVSLIEGSRRRMETLRSITSILLKAKNVPGALWATEQFEDPEYRSSALSDIAVAQADTGDIAGARVTLLRTMRLIAKIEDPMSRANSLSSVVVAYARMDNMEQANAMLLRAFRFANDITNSMDRGTAWTRIVVARAMMGDVNAAFSAANANLSGTQLGSALNTIVMNLIEVGDIEEALEVSRRMVTLDDQVEQLWIIPTFNAIAMAQIRAGDEEGAGITFSEATRIAKYRDFARVRWIMLSMVATAQLSTGYVVEALQHAGAIGSTLLQPTKPTNALVTADQAGYDYIARVAMGRIFASAGRTKIRDVRRAVDVALNIDPSSSRAAVLAIIAIFIATTEHESA